MSTSSTLSIESQEPSQPRRRITGAGVLVMTSKYNKPYFLLGREKFKSLYFKNKFMIPVYEEFGGGLQTRRISIEDNALMELDEETAHTLNWQNRKVLLKKGFFQIDIPFKTNRMYRIYVIYVPNVEKVIPTFFRNYNMIIANPTKYYKKENFTEMDDLQLISLDDIYQTLKNKSDKDVMNLINGDTLLKLRLQNKYLSHRLYQFFDDKFHSPYTNRLERGYEICFQMYEKCHSLAGFNDQYYITLTRPFINKKNHPKMRFLNDTTTYEAK
jgi:hypothetical protein